ncbi:MAG: hypothetical protein HKN87_03110, partial [Saprospiraceae bacterium]|nr:hypothetical protein [Saprospiraceae bacterium]
FIFVILTSRFWPARTMMALPIMTAGIIYLGLQQIPRGPRRWMSIMAVLCYFGFVQSNTKLFYSDYVTWQNDKLLANRIVTAVESRFGDLLLDNPLPIVFIGHPTRSPLPIQKREEHFGGSVLEWDRGSNHRILALFRLIGCDYFTLANTAQINQAKGEATEMPVWPASASISMVDEIIVVKFSEVADEH